VKNALVLSSSRLTTLLALGALSLTALACGTKSDEGLGTGGRGAGTTGGSTGTGGSAGSGGGTGGGGAGGAGATGGSAGKGGGPAGSGGASGGSGGAAGSGGATGGSSGAGGTDGGIAGRGGNAGTAGGAVMDAGRDGTNDGGVRDVNTADNRVVDAVTGDGPSSTRFSFFVTSLAGLRALSGNQNGFGGDLRFGKPTGLEGADEICRQLAERSMPGNGKEWRAFLSVAMGPAGTPVNAIDRIGPGPWYDRLGRLLAMSKANVGSGALRPTGADPAILNDLPNEDGVPNHNPDGMVVDNHHFMTGSTATGTLYTSGATATCQDWTTTVGTAGKPRCGFSWPRTIGSTQPNGAHWISGIDEAGCAAQISINGTGGAPPGSIGVGSGGGYGGIYCFALTP
jgi:hypothetical protein